MFPSLIFAIACGPRAAAPNAATDGPFVHPPVRALGGTHGATQIASRPPAMGQYGGPEFLYPRVGVDPVHFSAWRFGGAELTIQVFRGDTLEPVGQPVAEGDAGELHEVFGDLLAVARDETVELLHWADGSVVHRRAFGDEVEALSWALDGSYLAVGIRNGAPQVMDPTTGDTHPIDACGTLVYVYLTATPHGLLCRGPWVDGGWSRGHYPLILADPMSGEEKARTADCDRPPEPGVLNSFFHPLPDRSGVACGPDRILVPELTSTSEPIWGAAPNGLVPTSAGLWRMAKGDYVPDPVIRALGTLHFDDARTLVSTPSSPSLPAVRWTLGQPDPTDVVERPPAWGQPDWRTVPASAWARSPEGLPTWSADANAYGISPNLEVAAVYQDGAEGFLRSDGSWTQVRSGTESSTERFSADGAYAVMLEDDRHIVVDTRTGEVVFRGADNRLRSLSGQVWGRWDHDLWVVGPDHVVAFEEGAAEEDRPEITLWVREADGFRAVGGLTIANDLPARAAALSPDGRTLAIGWDGHVLVYDVGDLIPLDRWEEGLQAWWDEVEAD